MVKLLCRAYLFSVCLLFAGFSDAQNSARPFIWVKQKDKAVILNNISTHQWLQDYYQAFTNRVQNDLVAYQQNAKAYFGKLPFDLSAQKPGQIPPFQYINNADADAGDRRNRLQHFLKTAIDCGIIYFLTDEEKYAQYSAAVFYTFMKSMLQLQPSEDAFNGGFIYQDDHLRESREIGAQMPVLYDFIYPYIVKGGKAYNFVTSSYDTVSIAESEKIFRTYVRLALGRGIVDCNWPVLESSSLVGNTLALGNAAERDFYLQYYLQKDTAHQDALPKVAAVFKESGDWPESLNYSSGVTELTTYLMVLLGRVDSTLHLGRKYSEVLNSVTLPYYLTFPGNGQKVLFGDGHRDYHASFVNYELAYCLGNLERSDKIMQEFGSLLKTGMADSSYRRSELKPRSYAPHPYFDEPLKLLWFSPDIVGEKKKYPKPATLELPFAGILLQRNQGPSGNPKHGLMGFVGGGAFVHGHASGMNMEIYGQGYVLGTKGGRAAYGTDIHENYYRLFAGHNTVIVNGASQGEGGWVNLAINTVKKIAMEPSPYTQPVSENYSFTTSGFVDDKGDGAEATQERTLGIIRTSPTSGYYVDIFRSESKLPDQFHDYVYHNIGDTLIFGATDKDFVLKRDEERFKSAQNKEWKKGNNYRNPGWHYFNAVESSNKYEKGLGVLFEAHRLGKLPVKMKLFVTGDKDREYTKALAPPSTESVNVYEKRPTPTLIIRKNGKAWDNPFAIVYESFSGNAAEGSVKAVESIMQHGKFKGLVVNSIVNGNPVKQIIIARDSDEGMFEDKALNINFTGRYAVLTLNDRAELIDLYIGEGSSLSFKNWSIRAVHNRPASLSLNLVNRSCTITSTDKFSISHPEGISIVEKILSKN